MSAWRSLGVKKASVRTGSSPVMGVSMRVVTSMWVGVLGAALLLSSAAPAATAQEPAAAPGADGAALYRQQCRSCHGARGVPPARMVTLYPTLKALTDSSLQAHLTTDSIVAVLRHGMGKDM